MPPFDNSFGATVNCIKMRFCHLIIGALAVVPAINSFVIPTKSKAPSLSTKKRFWHAKSDDEDVPKGMEDAFRQLDAMKALGDDAFAVPEPKIEADAEFAKALEDIDLGEIKTGAASPESEVKLYEEMASEIEGKSEEELIASMKQEIEGTTIGGTVIPKFDPTMRDSNKFMEKALEEAMAEAGKKADAPIDKSSLLDNKEIMKEIEAVFDKANDKLIAGLEEIREEQVSSE